MKRRPAAAQTPAAKRSRALPKDKNALAVKQQKSPSRPKAATAPAAKQAKLPKVKLVVASPTKPSPKKPKLVENCKAPSASVNISLLKDGVLIQNRRHRPCHAVWEEKKFAEGEFRYVYRGKYDQGERCGEECVRKEFKTGCVFESSFFKNDIRTVQKAAQIIKKFNALGVLSKPIYVVEPEVWVGDAGCSLAGQKMLVEPMITGEYFKFNSNTGYSSGDSDAMQALSHFSYHESGGEYLLCDLQGGRHSNCYVITDPVILSKGKHFGPTDLGEQGINNFMAHHKCTRFCNPKWSLPAPVDLIPMFKAVSGTTFGAGVPVFSCEQMQKLQAEVRKCWEKHLPKGTPGNVRLQLT
jgi:hypothetical protein